MGPTNGYQIIKQTKVIHLAIAMAAILFAGVSIFISRRDNMDKSFTPEVLHYVIAGIISVVSLVIATVNYKKAIEKAAAKDTLLEKMEAYRSACISRYTFVELPILICIVLFFLSGGYFFFIPVFILLVFHFLYTPSADQASNHLQLNQIESESIRDPYTKFES